MELGMREWFLVIGGVMIVGVLAHGAWLFIRNRRDALGVRYEQNIPDIDVDDIDLLRGELPTGGARVVTASAAEADLASQQAALEDAAPIRADARVDVDEPVPVLLDPIDQDVARAAEAEAVAEASSESAAEAPAEAIADVDESPVEAAAAPEAPIVDEVEADAPEPAPVVPEVEDAPTLVRPETSSTDAGAAPQAEDETLAPAPPADFEQAPLFAGEPIVDRGEPRESGRRKRRAPRAPEKPAPEVEAPAPEPLGPPEEVIVINVLCRGDAVADGPTLVEAITEQGMRFGDMNIFHRASPGDRSRTDFSLASAVEPGTFDLGAMDGFTTRGVTIFMQLPGPAEPIEAFDDMVRIARGIASRIGGDLKDEQHSVMTGQTIEHCRQRVSEFTRRQMSRRA